MAIFLSHETLSRFHEYARAALPNETHATLTGFEQGGNTYITGFLPSIIDKPSPHQVKADVDHDMKRGEYHYLIGFAHTHPPPSPASPSGGDRQAWLNEDENFFTRFKRKPLFMVYAPGSHDLAMFSMPENATLPHTEELLALYKRYAGDWDKILPLEARDYTVLERMPDPPPQDQKKRARLRKEDEEFHKTTVEAHEWVQKVIRGEVSELSEWLPFIFFWLAIAGIFVLLVLFPWSLFLFAGVVVLVIIAFWLAWVAADK